MGSEEAGEADNEGREYDTGIQSVSRTNRVIGIRFTVIVIVWSCKKRYFQVFFRKNGTLLKITE